MLRQLGFLLSQETLALRKELSRAEKPVLRGVGKSRYVNYCSVTIVCKGVCRKRFAEGLLIEKGCIILFEGEL